MKMTFEFKDSRGRRYNSVHDMLNQMGTEIISDFQNDLSQNFETVVREETSELRCPSHNQTINSISIVQEDSEFAAQFDSCCDKLKTLANKAIANGLKKGGLNL